MSGILRLADEVVYGLRARLPALLAPHVGDVRSFCVCGSYVRGDFTPGSSDLDFNIIYAPGRVGAFPIYDDSGEPAALAVRNEIDRLLEGRTLGGHNPYEYDWIPLLWEWVPRRRRAVHLPSGGPNFRYWNIFMFDYIEHLLVLWGNDPRTIMPDPPDVASMAREWFAHSRAANERGLADGTEFRIPLRAYTSIQVAQIVFGERTIDKRRMLALYDARVPDFPGKEFGRRVIADRVDAHGSDEGRRWAPWRDYMDFEERLATVVAARLDENYQITGGR